MSKRRFLSADGLAILTVVIWGAGISVSKVVMDHVDVLGFLAIRSVGSALLLFAALWAVGENLRVKKAEIGLLALLGVVGMGLTQIGFLFGIEFTNASYASVLVGMGPVFAALMAVWMGWERAKVVTWCAFGICMIGVWLLVGGGQGKFGLQSLLGVFCLLGSALCWAAHIVVGKQMLVNHSPLKVSTYATAFSNFLVVPIGVGSIANQNWKAVTFEVWAGIVFTVVFSLVLANLFWLESVKEIGVTRTALYQYLVPVVGVIVAVLFLKERLDFQQAIAATIILIGIGLATWSRVTRSLPELGEGSRDMR